jgi:hypothetical protein
MRDVRYLHKQFAVIQPEGQPDQIEPLTVDLMEIERQEAAKQQEDFRVVVQRVLSNAANQPVAGQISPELVVQDYKGFKIFTLESRYYALPQKEDFDVKLIRTNQYSWSVVGHSLPEVKREIDQAFPEGYIASKNGKKKLKRERALFICNVSFENSRAYLNQLQDYDLTLLSLSTSYNLPGYTTLTYLNAKGQETDTIDIANTSSTLLQTLRQENFDLVIIPYEGRKYWDNVHLENFVAAFASRMMVMFPNGQIRFYAGEDIHRIQYNKAYLNSMFRFVPQLKGKKILEVGCSDGLGCDLLLSEAPAGIVGIDVMETVGCNYPDPRIIYAKMDAAKLLFEDHTFDLC